jgi:UDP-N-acetylmuramyl pentapeptide phosphotransferase/UDP-N-acetylglucosamine-1-phosphate transferase
LFRFLLSTFVTALTIPVYLKWSRDQAEGQIDKMQSAVHGTPGAEAPVTPAVLLGGAGLLAGHWLLTRLLGLRFWQSFLSLLLAIGAGFGFYFFGASTAGSQRKSR